MGSVTFGSTTDDMSDLSTFTLSGFRKVTGGSYTETYHHWYLAESRSPILQDRSLCGAYQFTTASWVEKHCYAKGLLLWYRNEGVADNNTVEHLGQGEILPIDSHPARMLTPNGQKAGAAAGRRGTPRSASTASRSRWSRPAWGPRRTRPSP